MEDETTVVPETAETVEETVEETPEVQPETETETEETETKTEEGLYELPDGRKLTGEQVKEEYLKLNSEFTRKSQELARAKNPPQAEPNKQEAQHPWDDPNWQPKTYRELMDAQARYMATLSEAEQAKERQAREQVSSWVQTQVEEIRKLEPELNEDLLFAHATKYGHNDLMGAYRSMKDMKLAVKSTEQKVVANMTKRNADGPVSEGTDQPDGEPTYQQYLESLNESPQEMLRRIKK